MRSQVNRKEPELFKYIFIPEYELITRFNYPKIFEDKKDTLNNYVRTIIRN